MPAACRAIRVAVGIFVAAATSAATTEAIAAADAGISNGRNYTVTTMSIDGSTPDTLGQWHVRAGQLAGGDAAVAEAFNQASQACARRQIDDAGADINEGYAWTLDAESEVSFRTVAISQVMIGNSYIPAAAHPLSYVNTVVIDSRTARPITLAGLFTVEQDGLNRLSEQTKILFAPGDDVMPDMPGNAPTRENFANWVPTAEGMEIHFADYQFNVHGLPVITVPWSALTDVLAPDMAALTQR